MNNTLFSVRARTYVVRLDEFDLKHEYCVKTDGYTIFVCIEHLVIRIVVTLK